MQEVRCTKCNKMLCKSNVPINKGDITIVERDVLRNVSTKEKNVEIKCPRCGTVNLIPLKD